MTNRSNINQENNGNPIRASRSATACFTAFIVLVVVFSFLSLWTRAACEDPCSVAMWEANTASLLRDVLASPLMIISGISAIILAISGRYFNALICLGVSFGFLIVFVTTSYCVSCKERIIHMGGQRENNAGERTRGLAGTE